LALPTLANGFVGVDMKTLVTAAGINQRRCERAIADLKDAELMEVKQPRRLNEHGD
jgi:Holliday junction resolvasome RuvABC DNA-binding subunit